MASIIKVYEDITIALTYDGDVNDSIQTAKQIAFLSMDAADLLTEFSPFEFNPSAEITGLGNAEEIGPGHLRRRILSSDKITPKLEKILWTP